MLRNRDKPPIFSLMHIIFKYFANANHPTVRLRNKTPLSKVYLAVAGTQGSFHGPICEFRL